MTEILPPEHWPLSSIITRRALDLASKFVTVVTWLKLVFISCDRREVWLNAL